METVRKFWRLSVTDKSLLVKSAGLVAVIRLGLWILPFQTLRGWLDRFAVPSQPLQPVDPPLVIRIARSVEVTSRYIPAATCLTQALATQVLLTRRGYPAELRIGVAKGDNDQLKAHAWVESGGYVVIGGNGSPLHFNAFPVSQGKRR